MCWRPRRSNIYFRNTQKQWFSFPFPCPVSYTLSGVTRGNSLLKRFSEFHSLLQNLNLASLSAQDGKRAICDPNRTGLPLLCQPYAHSLSRAKTGVQEPCWEDTLKTRLQRVSPWLWCFYHKISKQVINLQSFCLPQASTGIAGKSYYQKAEFLFHFSIFVFCHFMCSV